LHERNGVQIGDSTYLQLWALALTSNYEQRGVIGAFPAWQDRYNIGM
jgi:hypothetical protein